MSSGTVEKGFVSLTGAGPGDPALLTVKGKQRIEEADVIVYDQLANEELLTLAKPGAERIDVGKRAGCHTMPQGEINLLLVQKAREGKRVLRLKGGDPFVFGRGGEEAETLREQGIPYEIIPGVTSATAVPAYAGIPVTHRDLTPTVTFVTGHEAEHNSRIPWEALAAMKGTLVFLMGLSNLGAIAKELTGHGMREDTPAAVIAQGTKQSQRTVTATLADIEEKVREAALRTPALIVVGEVVRLREKLSWFEDKPLFGQRVLVTAQERLAKDAAALLHERGAEALQLPLIRIVPLQKGVDELRELFLKEDFPFDCVTLTSANAVRLLMDTLLSCGKDLRVLGGVKAAAVGEKTAACCKEYGLLPDFVPERFEGDALADLLLRELKAGSRVLLPCAKDARKVLPQTLKEAGHRVTEIALYETAVREEAGERIREALDKSDWISFASASAVHAFFGLLAEEDIRRMKEAEEGKKRFAVIGPVTGEALKTHGFAADATANNDTVSDMTDAIQEWITNQLREE